MAIQNKVHVEAGTLFVWTSDTEAGRAFLSIKEPGKPWELDLLMEAWGFPGVWAGVLSIHPDNVPGWNALMDSHLDVRDRVLRGR